MVEPGLALTDDAAFRVDLTIPRNAVGVDLRGLFAKDLDCPPFFLRGWVVWARFCRWRAAEWFT